MNSTGEAHFANPSLSNLNATGEAHFNSRFNAKEDVSNKITSISSSSTNIQYPSAKLVYTELAKKVDISSLVNVYPIISYYVEGTEGWITYANGMHEEWGLYRPPSGWHGWVDLIVPYRDVNYNVSLTLQGSEPSSYYAPLIVLSATYPKENGRFYVAQYNISASYPNRKVYWRTLGFIGS